MIRRSSKRIESGVEGVEDFGRASDVLRQSSEEDGDEVGSVVGRIDG